MAVRHLFRVIIQDCSATKEEGWFYGATGIVGLGRHRSSVVIGRPLGRSMLYYFTFLLKGMFINDVPHFLAIFDLPTYLVLLYNVPFLGLSWTPYLP